jgi:beta-glucosidase
MLKTMPLKTLLSLAAGVLLWSDCKLGPPPPFVGTTGGGTATCNAVDASVDDASSEGGGFVTVTPLACNASNAVARLKYTDGYTPNPADMATVKSLMQSMSLKDECNQMRGTLPGAAGLTQMSDTQRSQDTASVRGFHYRDASRGMNLAEDMNGHIPNAAIPPGISSPAGYSTTFPVSMARGAAFDLDLEYAIGEAIGDEMMAANETLLLAPCMNILRHPLWGRAQETYGEDAFQIGRLASAMVEGVQQHIAANAKHYMAYDIENNRDFNNMTLDEQTLRETFGRHFRMVVQDGGVASVMASYNQVNGEKSTVNGHTLTDVMRTDFGFQGFILSDWWAMDPQTDLTRPSSFYVGQAQKGVTAGLDVELPWSLNFSTLESIVSNNEGVTKADIDAAVTRILMQKVRFNAYHLTGQNGLGTPKTS